MRINSGWYNPQEPGMLRMNLDLTIKTMHQKAGYTAMDSLENVNKYGLYMFTHVLTEESYVGKAERQPLCRYLMQHLKMTSSGR